MQVIKSTNVQKPHISGKYTGQYKVNLVKVKKLNLQMLNTN